MSDSNTVPTLGYWDIRGLAQSIRYLLKYSGVQYRDHRYQFANASEWTSTDKLQLGLDFPNLPYYMEGDIKLTQSLAILRYLGRKHGLVATSDPGLARQEMAEQQLQDMRQSFVFSILREEDYESKRQEYCQGTLQPQLDLLVKFLGDNKWLTGQEISYVDFIGYEVLDWLRRFTPETLAKYPTVEKYSTRFEALPAIKAYQSSDEYKSWPLFGPRAKWGSK